MSSGALTMRNDALQQVHSPTASVTTRQSWVKRHQRTLFGILFLLPALLFLGVYVVWPLYFSAELSFYRWNGLDPIREYVGFANWERLLGDAQFWNSLRNNLTVVVTSLAIQIPFGILLGFILAEGGRKYRLFKMVYFFPMLMSGVALAVLFKRIYDPNFGLLNTLLKSVGLADLTQVWLGDPNIALFAVILVICWQFIPFYMILFIASFSNVPEELREAARLDGASTLNYLWSVALPYVQGTIRTASIICVIGSLKYFELLWVMTEGGPAGASELMATYMYKKAFPSFEVGYGSTVATALFIIVMVISALTFALTRRFETKV